MKKNILLIVLLIIVFSLKNVFAEEISMVDSIEEPSELVESEEVDTPQDEAEEVLTMVEEILDTNDNEEVLVEKEKITITVYCDDKFGNSIDVKTFEFNKDEEYNLPEIEIDGYTYLSVVGEQKGVALEDFEIHFIYEEIINNGNVVVSYVLEDDKKISEDKVVSGKVGESYSVEAKYIKGYDVVSVKGNEKGVFQKEDTHVSYVYAEAKSDIVYEAKGSVVIHYMDALGNKLSGNVTLRGYAGNHYDAYVKKIDGYKLVRVEGEEHGEFNSGTKHVIYVYEATRYGVGSTGRMNTISYSTSSRNSEYSIPNTGVFDSGFVFSFGSAISFIVLVILKKWLQIPFNVL